MDKCFFLIISTPLGKINGILVVALVCTYSEKYKESLILFSHTVINPGTVVIHLPDASFTNTAGGREARRCYCMINRLCRPLRSVFRPTVPPRICSKARCGG